MAEIKATAIFQKAATDATFKGGAPGKPNTHIWIVSAHPEMANLPDIGVARKILSSEYLCANGAEILEAMAETGNRFTAGPAHRNGQSDHWMDVPADPSLHLGHFPVSFRQIPDLEHLEAPVNHIEFYILLVMRPSTQINPCDRHMILKLEER